MITVTTDTYVPYDKINPVNPVKIPDVVVYPKIFGGNIGKKISLKLKNYHVVSRYYKKVPNDTLRYLLMGITKLTGLLFDSYVINGKPKFYRGPYVTIIFLNNRLSFKKINSDRVINIDYKKGTLFVFRDIDKYWFYSFPKHMVITFFNSNIPPLHDIYLNNVSRTNFSQIVKDKLNYIKKQPIGKQCITKYLKLGKMLGKGDYGNVYQSDIPDMNFAIKISKLKSGAINKPYSRFNSSWFEILIMRDILNYNITNGICPNIPLLLDSFVCDDCKLTIRDLTKRQPCVILITEIANGSFRDFLKMKKLNSEQLYSALFQIMASLHAIQLRGQIMNFDVKADNILFYRVTPGGYWEYIIHGIKFYVPNIGYLFVLNDFGISRPMSPKFQLYKDEKDITFRLGSRYAIVKNGKFSPLEAKQEPNFLGENSISPIIKWSNGTISRGAQFRLWKNTQKIIDCSVVLTKSQKKFLRKQNITTNPLNKDFFLNPEIIPPFEFYNDTQDAIRIFVGGKRTTQKGNHRRYPVVTDDIYNKIKMFCAVPDNMKERKFSLNPEEVLAGYFIKKFFVTQHNYTIPIVGKKWGKYVMS